MATADQKPAPSEAEAAGQRRLEAMHLQEIESNPLDAGDVAMFEMFEREGWSPEQCTAYILDIARGGIADAAE